MKKINVAELLKNCPTDMELDSPMYDNLYFGRVEEDHGLLILCYTIYHGNKTAVYFTEFGSYNTHKTAKCVIFPKGKTTWEGFVPPCKFKDGDIITDSLGTCIFKGEGEFEGTVNYYCGISNDYFRIKDDKCNPSGHYGYIVNYRLSTKEEKERLFRAIKDNGYQWNAETKTLEKLIQPKFKVGDKVRHKNNHNVVFTITSIEEDSYVCGAKMAFWFDDQDQYELVPNKFNINTLVPFESRVLVRYNKEAKWCPAIWGFYDYEKGLPHRYAIVGGITFAYCIPYEGNEHLLGKTEDCKNFYKTWE